MDEHEIALLPSLAFWTSSDLLLSALQAYSCAYAQQTRLMMAMIMYSNSMINAALNAHSVYRSITVLGTYFGGQQKR